MEQLLEISNIDYIKLRSICHKASANALSNLSEPCHYPPLQKHYFELLYVCGVTDKDVKEYTKRFWKGRPEAKWGLNRDAKLMMYIFCMHVLLIKKDYIAFESLMILCMIRNYTNEMHKVIQFCNVHVFKYTMEHLTKTHLYSREKTISNAIFYLAKEMMKKYKTMFLEADKDGISKFIREGRSRINQSIRGFQRAYYKNSKDGVAIQAPLEDEEGGELFLSNQDKGIKVIDDTIKKITVYKVVDRKSLDEAKKLTKINTSLAVIVTKALGNVKYTEDIKMILQLFLKKVTNIKGICGKEFYSYTRSLMAIKRTKEMVYFKQQINLLLVKILKDLKYIKKYNKITKQTQFLINLFLAYYITILFRNAVCPKKR